MNYLNTSTSVVKTEITIYINGGIIRKYSNGISLSNSSIVSHFLEFIAPNNNPSNPILPAPKQSKAYIQSSSEIHLSMSSKSKLNLF